MLDEYKRNLLVMMVPTRHQHNTTAEKSLCLHLHQHCQFLMWARLVMVLLMVCYLILKEQVALVLNPRKRLHDVALTNHPPRHWVAFHLILMVVCVKKCHLLLAIWPMGATKQYLLHLSSSSTTPRPPNKLPSLRVISFNNRNNIQSSNKIDSLVEGIAVSKISSGIPSEDASQYLSPHQLLLPSREIVEVVL